MQTYETSLTSKPLKSDFLIFIGDNKKILLIIFFIFVIILILLIVISKVNTNRRRHLIEMARIVELENRQAERKQIIKNTREQTLPCSFGLFDTPRNCYIKSNYKCHWNEDADRCNLIQN